MELALAFVLRLSEARKSTTTLCVLVDVKISSQTGMERYPSRKCLKDLAKQNDGVVDVLDRLGSNTATVIKLWMCYCAMQG